MAARRAGEEHLTSYTRCSNMEEQGEEEMMRGRRMRSRRTNRDGRRAEGVMYRRGRWRTNQQFLVKTNTSADHVSKTQYC